MCKNINHLASFAIPVLSNEWWGVKVGSTQPETRCTYQVNPWGVSHGTQNGIVQVCSACTSNSTEIKVKWTYLEELRQDWGPWCQNMSQLCPSRLRCCRTANEMFILFVLLWYFWYWILVYFNKSTGWGVACFKCTTFNKVFLALIFEGRTFKIYRSSTNLPFVASL